MIATRSAGRPRRGPVSTARRALAPALGAMLVALAGCKIERLRHPDTAGVAASSGATATAAVADSLVGIAGDTAPVVVPPPAVAPPPSESIAPAAAAIPPSVRGDTASVTATAEELRALAAVLAIPVDGVRAGDLRDTYTESRAGGSRPHDAIDILAPRGTPVRSAADGRLLKLHESVPGGHMVYAADASDRFVLMYGHLDRYADGLAEGMPLRRGQLIGYVGTSGNAPANTPHLHFAIARGHPSTTWWRGTPVNPYPLLAHPGAP